MEKRERDIERESGRWRTRVREKESERKTGRKREEERG